ncbi:MAG: Ni/Fe-hydrogenase, b-type cytochrome subunit [Sulfuricella sp.]|nr:Ni/Fe-hydrogenase, b-type cytochrome subunit [Sulfuricella sp.]
MPKFIHYHRMPEKGMLPPVMVYGPGVRIWHWLNALAVVVLGVTGYFIGMPPPSVIGDTSTLYVMGWIRFYHLAFGYVFALLAIMRLWLVFVEGGVTLQLYVPAIWRRDWLDGFIRQIKWNLLMAKPLRYVGLNPLGSVTMLTMFVIPGAVMILTGFAMYAEVAGHDSWQYFLFGWLTMLFGNTLDLHLFHRLAMWVMMWFVMVHVYIAVREDILSRQTVISTMLSGERQFRD